MAWNEIKLNISAGMDFGDAERQIKSIKEGIDGLKSGISEMPNVSRILDNSLDKTATIVDSLSSKLDKLKNGEYRNNDERAAIERSANSDVLELNALRSLEFGKTDYSTTVARQWFGNLPQSIQHQFDVMAPKVSAIIRTRLSQLSKNGNGINERSAQAIASRLLSESHGDAQLQNLMRQYQLTSEEKFQFDQFVKYLTPNVVSKNRFGAYQQARYGSTIQNERVALDRGEPVDLFPKSYQQTFLSKGATKNTLGNAYRDMVLAADYRKQLNALLENNPVAVRAAISSGISRRDDRGVLETRNEITRSQWENFRTSLYDDLLLRASGYEGIKVDPYSAAGKDKKTLVGRLTSSSSGRAMLAMHDIEAMENAGAWSAGTGSTTWSKLPTEGKRILDEHVVTKYSPFKQGVDPRKIMIPESQATRMLGRFENNQDISDIVSMISLAGYNAADPKQRKYLTDLFKNGQEINGRRYIAQSIHGTGEDAVIRMIEQEAYNRVNERENKYIKGLFEKDGHGGVRGNFWEGFNDAEIQRRIDNGTITAKDWGKHLEMRNKPWTPSADLGLNLDGKRFAVVDMKGFGDGGAWLASSVAPHSGQFRAAFGLKGSSFIVEGNDMAAFGRKTGLMDDQGRVMMPGPDGQMYDVSGYQGIIPLDVAKNMGLIMDENGKMLPGPAASERMTAMIRRTGIGYHADYNVENLRSDRLGTQMASFIDFSPEVRQHQIDMAMRRMGELDTEAGMLKYVFNNPDDYLSRMVNPAFGGDSQLLSTEQALQRVDNHRNALYGKLIAGQYIDFGEDDTEIANLRAMASPLAASILANGGEVPAATLAQARKFIQRDAEKRGVEVPQYTDQQIKDMIILPKDTVLDFNNPNAQNVSVIRSPTGYGNMMYARNLAAQALPIYQGFGLPTQGMYISEQNRDQLQSLDFDADQVKAIYNDSFASSVKAMGDQFRTVGVPTQEIQYTKEQLADAVTQQVLLSGRTQEAPLGMGTGSSGIRIRQLDLSNPANQKFIEGALKMQGIYDTASVLTKNPKTYDLNGEDAVWAALGIGKEFTKFTDKRDTLFQYDPDMLNEQGELNTNHKDVYRAANGKYVNLRALRDMGVEGINLPARFMPNHLMALGEASTLYRAGMVDTSYWDAVAEALDKKVGYGDAGPARQALMKSVRTLQTQFASGERTHLTQRELNFLEQQRVAASTELEASAEGYFVPSEGVYRKDGKTYSNKNAFIKSQEARYGINTARNAIESFGINEDFMRSIFGEGFEQTFANAAREIGVTAIDRAGDIQKELDKVNAEIERREKGITTPSNDKLTANGKIISDESGNKVVQDVNGNLQFIPGAASGSVPPANQDAQEINEIFGTPPGSPSIASKTARDATLEELKAQRDQLLKDQEVNNRNIEFEQRFGQIFSDLKTYNDDLLRDQLGKQNKITDEKPLAQRRFNYLAHRTFDQLAPLEMELKSLEQNTEIDQKTKDDFIARANLAKGQIADNMQKSFTNGIILDAKNMYDSIAAELDKAQNAPTKQKQTVDKYDELLKTNKESVQWMQGRLDRGLVQENYKQQYQDAIKQTNDFIAQTETARQGLVDQYTQDNERAARAMLDGLQIKHGLKNKNSLTVRSEARLQEISKAREIVDKNYKEGYFSEKEYNSMIAGFEQLEKAAHPVKLAMKDMFKPMKQEAKATFGYLSNMFTRKLFNAAIQETTNFVKQFDSSMNTIQMITLKSDEEISKLGSSLIDRAKELKVSVAEITSSAATLYRQGLSDQEVDERLEVVSKFSKVSGTKVDAATKLITVAMNTGLVKQAEEASDIVTALGDNAATNAAEIEKGIEKAGAAAAADGTSFAQLASMLTAITSTTQIGGNVAGRTLNTIIGRMNKIGTNELIYDENGNAVSGSAVAKLLESEGIRMYDERGNKRSTFDTLYALSQRWEGLSDAKQQQFANAIAGTRQYSNFAAIMQGMAEGKVDEYLALAGESSGITDKKYEIYTKSLNASLTDLKNTWDGLVHDMTDSGALGDALGFFTNFISGIDKANESLGGLGVTLTGLLPTLMVMGGLKSGNIAGYALAGVGLASMAFMANRGAQEDASEVYSGILDRIDKQYSEQNERLSRARELSQKETRTADEQSEYEKLLKNIAVSVNYEENKDKTAEEIQKNASQLISDASDINDVNRFKKLKYGLPSKIAAMQEETQDLIEDYDSQRGSFDSGHYSDWFKEENGEFSAENLIFTRNKERKNLLTVLGFNKWYDENNKRLVDLLSMSAQDLNDERATWDEKQWSEYIDSLAEGAARDEYGNFRLSDQDARLFDRVFSNYSDYVNLNGRNATLNDVYKNAVKTYLSEFYTDASEEELEKDAQYLIDQYLKDNPDLENINMSALSDLIYSEMGLLGEGQTAETYREKRKELASKAGYIDKRAQRLAELGLEDAGENGYYIDLGKQPGEAGYYLSEQQAINRVNRYNNQKDFETSTFTAFDKDDARVRFDTFYTEQEGSKETAKEKALGVEYYKFKDPKTGQVFYTDSEGNLLTSRRQAEEAAGLYDKTHQVWTASAIQNYDLGANGVRQTPYVFTGTKEEVEALAEAKRLELNNSAYRVVSDKGRLLPSEISALRGTEEEMLAAAEEYNTAEQAREASDRLEAIRKQAESRTVSYYDKLTGETYTATGAEASRRLEEQYNTRVESLKDQLFLYDKNGNILGQYDTLSAADEAREKYTRYFDSVLENEVPNAAREYYDQQLVPGTKRGWLTSVPSNDRQKPAVTYLGFGEDVQQLASQFASGSTIYGAADATGQMHYASTQRELMQYAPRSLEYIRESLDDWQKRYAETESTYDETLANLKQTLIDKGVPMTAEGEPANIAALWMQGSFRNYDINDVQPLYDKYFETKTNKANALSLLQENIDKTKSEYEGSVEAFNQSVGKYIFESADATLTAVNDTVVAPFTEDVVSDMDISVAQMRSIKAADHVSVFGKLAEKTEAVADEASEVMQVSIDAAEEAQENLQKVKAPQIKTVKDYFLSGATSSYLSWQTDTKNSYATTVDNMIRMMRGSGANDVQSLLKYVNENGIKEWSSLYQNAEFGKIMSQIKRNSVGRVTMAPEDIMQQIENFLYENGRDYGAQETTFAAKTAEARKAFLGLTGQDVNELGQQVQWLNSYQAFEQVYKADRDRFIESLDPSLSEPERRRIIDYYDKNNNEITYSRDKNLNYMTTLQEGYLTEILGNELAAKVKNGDVLTDAEKAYANTLFNNYQFGIKGLTARDRISGFQNILSMSPEQYRQQYAQTVSQMAMASAYGEGFSEFSRWQQLMSKDNLSSEEKTELAAINENAANYLRTESEKLNFRYAGDKNASKLLQNYSTLLEGSMSERVAMLSSYISQGREMANVQDILSGDISTEADRKAISSLLGLSDKDVKDLAGSQQGKNKLQKLLDDKTGKMMEEFVKSFGVDIHSENLMADMQAEAALRGQYALDAVNSFFDIIESFTVDAEGHVTARAKEAPTTRAGDYYANAAEGYANQTRNARAAAWFRDNYDAIASLVGTSYIDQTGPLKWEKKTYDWQEAISKIAEEQGLKPEEFSEYWNNNVYGLQKASENGLIDKDVLSLYNNAQISGGKYKNNLDIALMKGLFGDNIDENGNFKADRINEIKQQMVEAVQDVDTGKFAMWTILAGDISQFADALQALENGDTDAAIEALTKVTETMNEARLDEMLKYMEVSKELPDILKNIAKGGADAEIAMVELDALFDEQYNQLVALEKVKGKAGKSLRGNDRSYFMSATGLKKAEVNELSADQVTALAEATEKKQVETIQNNLVALLKSPGEKLDFSKLIFGEGGTIDVSEAIKNLPSDVQTEWKRVQDTLNKAVKDEYITINFPTLFKLAGYTSDKDIEKMVNQKDLKKAKETLTGTLDKLYSSMTADERSKLSFNTDLTIDTANLKPAQAAMVKEWNAYCQANPLVAAVAVSTTGGTGMSTSVTGGGYKTYADAFNALEGKSTEELTQIYLKDQIAVAVTGKKAYTTRRSGGGGGGGGNAIQKLLQDQQYEIKAKEHERKMAQIEQTKYNRLNNQDSYFAAINNEKTAIDNLEATQRKHISALEEQLKKAQAGSDEYKKLTEAINTAKEALANYENEIAEVQAKRIQFIQKQQENADKPKSHERTMFETLAEGSLSSDKFKDYEDYTTKNIAEISKQIKQNNDQKAQWEQELYNFTEGSDEWIEIRDKIWGIEEETAQLENESVSKTLELNQQRLSQIAKVLQENTQQATHNQKIASIYEGYYQQAGYRKDYEKMITEQKLANEKLIKSNKEAEASARERMNAEKQGTTAYFEAQAAVYQYQEAIAQLEVSQLSLNRALAESRIDKVSEDYNDAVREVSHVNELLQSQAQEYIANNDYTSYTSAMERYLNNIPEILNAEKTALAELQAQYEEGIRKGSLDIAMQRRLQDEINSREKAIQDLQIEQAQKERELDKTNLDWMIENFDRDASNYSHNMNLVQYQATKYQNAGELTNYGNAIRQESALRAENVVRLAREIDALEQKRLDYQIKYGKGSDLEIEVVEQIKKREEALKSENVEIEKNTKLLEENEQKIRQTQKTLEDAVDKEIEDEKRRKKEILSANVSMQDTILDLLKKSLQEQWALRKKDIDKEKENLSEYKRLINERYQYRKDAANQADKEEELAEYRRQLALIEADPTRSKDAKELRRKISDIEKEQAWAISDAELQAENERVDNQSEALDKYVSFNEERLDEILSDANNFSAELNEILSGSYEESYKKILDFMSKENEAFVKSLPEAQQQMIQGWEDTWKQAKDIIDSNYQEITKTILNKDQYLEFMRKSQGEQGLQYRKALESGDLNTMRMLEYEWGEKYDNYANALKNDSSFDLHDHTIDYTSDGSKLDDKTMSVAERELIKQILSAYGFDYGSLVKAKDFSTGSDWKLNDYAGVGYVAPPTQEEVDAAVTETSGGGGGGGGSSAPKKKYMITVVGGKNSPGAVSSYEIPATSEADVKRQLLQKLEKLGYGGATISNITIIDDGTSKDTATPINTGGTFEGIVNRTKTTIKTTVDSAVNTINSFLNAINNPTYNATDKNKKMYKFASGGLVDYTGPAWVDGTPQRPEVFLSPKDTENIRAMLDAFNYVRVASPFVPSASMLSSNNTQVGDINITINQAELKDDADFDEVARRVGQAFTKELSKRGLNLSRYAM